MGGGRGGENEIEDRDSDGRREGMLMGTERAGYTERGRAEIDGGTVERVSAVCLISPQGRWCKDAFYDSNRNGQRQLEKYKERDPGRETGADPRTRWSAEW